MGTDPPCRSSVSAGSRFETRSGRALNQGAPFSQKLGAIQLGRVAGLSFRVRAWRWKSRDGAAVAIAKPRSATGGDARLHRRALRREVGPAISQSAGLRSQAQPLHLARLARGHAPWRRHQPLRLCREQPRQSERSERNLFSEIGSVLGGVYDGFTQGVINTLNFGIRRRATPGEWLARRSMQHLASA